MITSGRSEWKASQALVPSDTVRQWWPRFRSAVWAMSREVGSSSARRILKTPGSRTGRVIKGREGVDAAGVGPGPMESPTMGSAVSSFTPFYRCEVAGPKLLEEMAPWSRAAASGQRVKGRADPPELGCHRVDQCLGAL